MKGEDEGPPEGEVPDDDEVVVAGAVYIGRASFRVIPVVRDSSADAGQVTTVSVTGLMPDASLPAGSAVETQTAPPPPEVSAVPPGHGSGDRALVVGSGRVPSKPAPNQTVPSETFPDAMAVRAMAASAIVAASTGAGSGPVAAVTAADTTADADPDVGSPRSRWRSPTLWVAAGAFVVGVVLTWSVGGFVGGPRQTAPRAEDTRLSVPRAASAPAPVPSGVPSGAVPAGAVPSPVPSGAVPAGEGLSQPQAVSTGEVPPGEVPPVPSVGDSAALSSVAPASEAPPVPSGSDPVAKPESSRSRIAHATGARATPERGHRPRPAHPKTARPPRSTPPAASARNARIEPEAVDPFDDAAPAPRPKARTKNFVDPFND